MMNTTTEQETRLLDAQRRKRQQANLVIKTLLGSMSDEELLELAKPIDDVDLEKLPTIKRFFGMEKGGNDA